MQKLNHSRQIASFLSGIGTASAGFGSLSFGYLSSTFRNRKMYFIISDLLMSSSLYMIFLDAELLNIHIVWFIIITTGLGVGNNSIIFTLCREYNAKNQCEETASGFVNGIVVSAWFIGQYVSGYLIDYHWERRNGNIIDGIRQYTVSDYTFGFECVIPSCLILAIITSCLLKETHGNNL